MFALSMSLIMMFADKYIIYGIIHKKWNQFLSDVLTYISNAADGGQFGDIAIYAF